MPLVTDVLRECHRLRKHLRNLQAEIDRGPRVLKGRQETLEAERNAHKDHYDGITKLKLTQRNDEGTLKQTDVRLAKLEGQLTDIVNQKEYEAKQSEIAQARAKKSDLEDAILATIAAIEEREAAIPAVEKKWADAQTEFAEFEREAAERLERLKADQTATQEALAKTEPQLPDTVRSRYDSLVQAHGPDAMAGLKGRVCQGCRTGITDQAQFQVQHGTFMLCPNCGKMLYVE